MKHPQELRVLKNAINELQVRPAHMNVSIVTDLDFQFASANLKHEVGLARLCNTLVERLAYEPLKPCDTDFHRCIAEIWMQSRTVAIGGENDFFAYECWRRLKFDPLVRIEPTEN